MVCLVAYLTVDSIVSVMNGAQYENMMFKITVSLTILM